MRATLRIFLLPSFMLPLLASAQPFGPLQEIGFTTAGAESIFTADLDGDGDLDVLSASGSNDKIAWYANNGNGIFGL